MTQAGPDQILEDSKSLQEMVVNKKFSRAKIDKCVHQNGITKPSEVGSNVLIGVTGSVAAIKLEELAEKLSEFATIKIVTTAAAKHFLDRSGKWGSQAIDDESEWHSWKNKGDPVQHIELSKWADLLLIAPLSANTLAKLAHGFCDNLLTSVFRAWDTTDEKKSIIVVPAMNTMMWRNAMTQRHLDELHNIYRVSTITPVAKLLACGDYGVGAMAHVDEISLSVRIALRRQMR